MQYFKIPLSADLSLVSYRARRDTEDAIYIEYNEGSIAKDWQTVTNVDLVGVFGHNPFEEKKELSQLDRIENAICISNEQLRQEGADSITVELIERGIL